MDKKYIDLVIEVNNLLDLLGLMHEWDTPILPELQNNKTVKRIKKLIKEGEEYS